MKIILTADVKGKGKAGDVIEVNNNFGKNCIINKGLGVEATPENLNSLKLKKKNEEKLEQEKIEKALKYKEALEKAELKIPVKVGNNGKLFGSVTNADIAKAIKNSLNTDIDKKNIICSNINTVGFYTVQIKLYKNITTSIQIEVIAC